MRQRQDVGIPISFKYFWADWPSPAHDVWDQNRSNYLNKIAALTAELQKIVPSATPIMLAKYFVAISLPTGASVPSFLRRTKKDNVVGYVPCGRSSKAKVIKHLMDTTGIVCPERQTVIDLGLVHETGYCATFYETTCHVKDDRIWIRVPQGGNPMNGKPMVPDYWTESNELECAHWMKHGRDVPLQLSLPL